MFLTRLSVPQALPLLLRVSILVLTAFIFVAVILPFRCSSHSAHMFWPVVAVLMALTSSAEIGCCRMASASLIGSSPSWEAFSRRVSESLKIPFFTNMGVLCSLCDVRWFAVICGGLSFSHTDRAYIKWR